MWPRRAFALTRAGIRNLRIVDRNPEGFEGPWMTYARMETLRSPKQLLGPAYGVASLTFRAWFTAQSGNRAWDELPHFPTLMDGIPALVPQRAEAPGGERYRGDVCRPLDNLLELEIVGGEQPSILTRRVVLANGREGLGAPTIPSFVRDLPRKRWSHSSDDFDFATLHGKRVVVIGVGASAMDNAAVALEEGAREVRLLARRRRMPTINNMGLAPTE